MISNVDDLVFRVALRLTKITNSICQYSITDNLRKLIREAATRIQEWNITDRNQLNKEQIQILWFIIKVINSNHINRCIVYGDVLDSIMIEMYGEKDVNTSTVQLATPETTGSSNTSNNKPSEEEWEDLYYRPDDDYFYR